MTDQTTEDTAAYCTCSAMRAIVDHHLKPMSAENTKLAAALTEAEAERESDPVVLDLRARLAEARAELALVRDFINTRREFVRALRQYSTEDRTDYHRWTGHAEARRVLAEELGLALDSATGGLVPGSTPSIAGPDPAERAETTTLADPEPTYVDITAPLGPAPLTLAQAATALHDWAGDLADGARTGWPAGHPDIIRGIRAAADWLDARDKYETEAREQHLTALREAGRRLGESFQQLGEAIRDGAAKARAEHEEREQLRALVDRHGMADRTCLIGDDTTE